MTKNAQPHVVVTTDGRRVSITQNERAVLVGIYQSDYADGGTQPHIWAWSINAPSIAKASLPGVVASLSKKGLVSCMEYDIGSDDNTIAVTTRGVDVARSLPELADTFRADV
jgi:hypothetical protein